MEYDEVAVAECFLIGVVLGFLSSTAMYLIFGKGW